MIRNLCNSMADAQGRELTAHGTPALPIACYNDDLEREKVEWHWHDEWEASIVVEGEVEVFAGAQREKFCPGDAFFINSRVLHTVENLYGGACRIYTIVFHPRLVGGDRESAFWQNYVQPLLSEPAQELFSLKQGESWKDEAKACFRTAWEVCRTGEEGFELELRHALSKLALLLRKYCVAAEIASTEKEKRSAARVKTMLQFIHARFGEELNTTMIAASASVSASECLRCFHSIIHCTPIQYLRRYRIQRSAELLRQTDMSVSEIGVLCGFQEMSYFARSFKEIRGCTPTEYRKLGKD